MATYLPGVTDYIPQIQPFVPDYNFLSNILQTKQSRYDEANKQVSQFYGKLLYSPMTREDNIKTRDEFFKTVDTELKKLSGIDLSLQQNQDYALNIFKPFYENKNIIKDMTWTRNRDNQLQRGESMRTCYDEKKCGGNFWEGGLDYIKYKTQEFKDATPEEALTFEDPKFNPAVNVYKNAVADLKAAGFEIKMQYSDGKYIYTDKNGVDMIPTLASYLQSSYQNDPQVRAYYNTLGYLDWKNFSSTQDPSADQDSILESYKTDIFKPAADEIKKEDAKAKSVLSDVDALRKTYEDYIRKNGIMGDEKALVDAYISINNQTEQAKSAVATTTSAVDHVNNIVNITGNKRAYLENLVQTKGMSMLNRDIYRAANQYAELTKEHTMTPDSYGVASYSSQLALNNQLTMAQVKDQIWREQKLFEKELEGADVQNIMGGPTPDFNAQGASSTKVDKNKALNSNKEESTRLTSDLKGAQNEYIATTVNTMKTAFSNPDATVAQKKTLQTTAKAMFANTNIDAVKLIAGDNQELKKLSNLSGKQIDGLYSMVTKLSDPDEPLYGQSNDFWNKDYNPKNIVLKDNVEESRIIKQIFDKDMQEQAQVVLGKVKEKYKGNPVKQLLAESFLNSVDGSYIPDLNSDTDIMAQASIFANTYGDKINGGKEAAYKYAKNHIKEIVEDWNTNYYEHGKAFNQDPRFKYANADESAAIVYKIDPAYKHNNNMVFADLIKNYKSSSSDVTVNFGDASKLREDDPAARQLLDTFISSFYDATTKRKNPSDKRAQGDISVQRIAAGDPNMMAFTIKNINPKFAEENMSTKSKTRILGADDQKYKEGVTVFIPKDAINNQFYQDSRTDAWDYALAKEGKLTVSKPGAGEIVLQDAGNGSYSITGNIRVKHENAPDEIIKVDNSMVRGPLDASTIRETWNRNLMQMKLYNDAVLANTREKYGIKDPQALLQSVMKNIENPQ